MSGRTLPCGLCDGDGCPECEGSGNVWAHRLPTDAITDAALRLAPLVIDTLNGPDHLEERIAAMTERSQRRPAVLGYMRPSDVGRAQAAGSACIIIAAHRSEDFCVEVRHDPLP